MPFQRHNVCMTGFARHLLPADWRLLTARERVCVGKRWVAVEKCSGGVGAGGQAWLWFCEITETTPWVRRHMTRWPITYSWWGQTERKVTAGHFFLIFLHSGMSRLLLLLHGHTAFPGCTPASVCVSVYAVLREWGPDAQHCHSGSVHTGNPRRKPWHLPLEMTTPPPRARSLISLSRPRQQSCVRRSREKTTARDQGPFTFWSEKMKTGYN